KVDLVLVPTFVAFHPWITLDGYRDLLETIAVLGLVENVAPVQLAIRLLIPGGSYLLDLPEVSEIIGPFDETALSYTGKPPDPRGDALQRDVECLVESATRSGADRRTIFEMVWRRVQPDLGDPGRSLPAVPPGRPRSTIPFLEEPWY